jgi:hypothetical protein
MSSQDRDFIEKAEPQLAPGPLFVVSMWRSGSSLLYALLNKHPQVALMYEADLLLLRSSFLKPKPFCDWAERWEFWNDNFKRHSLNLSDAPSGISDFPRAFAAVHKLYAQRRGATIWGDKSPNYYDCLNEMADAFPEARFIIVWRDPKGTANAVVRAATSGSSYFRRRGAALCGLLGNEKFKQECNRLRARGLPVCEVNYEDLTQDAASVMRQVCDFLQITYDDSLTNLQGADRSAIFEEKHHSNIKGDAIVKASRPELLDLTWRRKISGYVVDWRQRYGPAWPPYPRPEQDAGGSPAWGERFADRWRYRLFRARDKFIWVAFCFVPISLLRRYRESKTRRREASNAANPVSADAGTTPLR